MSTLRVLSARSPARSSASTSSSTSSRTCRPIATLNAADAILLLAALGFLGYGIQPTQGAEWGYDINRAVSDASSGIWWTGLFPGLAIVLLVTGLTLVGEGLNETLNPVLRRRHFGRIEFPALGEEQSDD